MADNVPGDIAVPGGEHVVRGIIYRSLDVHDLQQHPWEPIEQHLVPSDLMTSKAIGLLKKNPEHAMQSKVSQAWYRFEVI